MAACAPVGHVFRHLAPWLRPEVENDPVDLSGAVILPLPAVLNTGHNSIIQLLCGVSTKQKLKF